MKGNGETSVELQVLERCLEMVQEKTGWGACSNWTQANFDRLSDQIHAKSGISISNSTLRRLFRQFQSNSVQSHPQIATKNALAIFLGFGSWDEFVQLQKPDRTKAVPRTRPSSAKNLVLYGFSSLVLVVFLSTVFFQIKVKDNPGERMKFTAQKVNNSDDEILFHYSKYPGKDNALRLDFGDGRVETLIGKTEEILHKYDAPGFYAAKLLSDDSVLSILQVHIGSPGWICAIAQDGNFYKIDTTLIDDGRLYISPASAAANGTDLNKPYWTFFRKVKDFGVSGDSFTSKIKVKNHEREGGISCYDININIMGEKEQIFFEFFEPGCTVWSDLKVGDFQRDGKKSDLSSFGQTFPDWRVITIEVKDRKFKVLLDEELIYTGQGYTKAIGDIRSVTITFKGTGSVDFLKLFDGSGKLIVNDEFDHVSDNTNSITASSRVREK